MSQLLRDPLDLVLQTALGGDVVPRAVAVQAPGLVDDGGDGGAQRDAAEGSIHRFHKDPARIERLLADRSNLPHRATFGASDALSTSGQAEAVAAATEQMSASIQR